MSSPSDALRWLFSIVAALAGLAFSRLIAPYAPLPPSAAYVIGFSCVVACVLGVAWCTPRLRPRAGAVPMLLGIAVLIGVRVSGAVGLPAALGVAAALLAIGSGAGGIVGSGIEHPGHLLFVALVSALADTFSVAHPSGPSAAIASSPVALSLLAVAWPMLGTEQIEPMLGVGDVVFAVLYVMASRVHGLSMLRTGLALALGFLATMLAVLATEVAVPALPFLGLAMLAVHPAARRPPAQDRTRGLAVVCGLSLLLVVLLAHRFF